MKKLLRAGIPIGLKDIFRVVQLRGRHLEFYFQPEICEYARQFLRYLFDRIYFKKVQVEAFVLDVTKFEGISGEIIGRYHEDDGYESEENSLDDSRVLEYIKGYELEEGIPVAQLYPMSEAQETKFKDIIKRVKKYYEVLCVQETWDDYSVVIPQE